MPSTDQPTPESSEPEQLSSWVYADDSRAYCTRPWRQMALLSDGTAVCACVDAEKTNPLGNLKLQSFDEVWNGPAYARLRQNIATDINAVPICMGCPNRIEGPPPPENFTTGVPRPQVLFIESYAGCNLSCPGCSRDGIEGSRSELTLDWDAYQKTIDALAPDLAYMEFHLGGENYMHKDASRMVKYCRDKNPKAIILTSTNGHFFHTDERVLDVLDSGIDCVIFSIDGTHQESYEKYRRNGRFDRVLAGMKRMVEMKRELGRSTPLIVWRYILFAWNDSPEEMDRARAMAKEIGVDEFTWHINIAQDQESSKRFYIGSPDLVEIKDELWDTILQRRGVDLGYDLGTYR